MVEIDSWMGWRFNKLDKLGKKGQHELSKKGQHEIAGFVLIVLIVSIIGVVFLSIAFAKGTSEQNSFEVSNLLESSMYATTGCAINYVPQYRDIQDLIKECYKDQSGNYRECLDSRTVEYLGDEIFLSPRHGPFMHTGLGGSARAPILVYNDLVSGEEIKISEISGIIDYVDTKSDCRDGPLNNYWFPAMVGFYEGRNLVREFEAKDFEEGVNVPSGADAMYVYAKEQEEYKNWYHDNTGVCSLKFFRESNVNSNLPSEGRGVCEILGDDLKKIIDSGLQVGEGAPNRGYKLDIYFSYGDEINPNEQILYVENGVFFNCTAVVGGGHSIAAGSFGFGTIETELRVCKG